MQKILRKKCAAEKGVSILLAVFIIALVLAAVGMALLYMLGSESREVAYRAKEKQAFYLAHAGAIHTVLYIQSSMESIYSSSHDSGATSNWLTGLSGSTVFSDVPLGPGTYSVQINSVTAVPLTNLYQATIHSTGKSGQVTKSVDLVVEFGFSASKVFDHAYFINNFGWLFGGAQTFQGEIRANGNFKTIGSQKVNGDIYASNNIDESQGNFFYDALDRYYSTAGDRARPGDPPAPGQASFPGGYDGFADNYDSFGDPRDPANPQLHANQDSVDMPYLGDLSYYQDLAQQKNGTVKIGGATVINNTYNGNAVLVGTSSNPIVIDGPVVVTGDLIIKGVVQGQGTIYSGRNTHIIGNLTYKNPPEWPKPDYNPTQTAADNVNKDFLGLASKGNVVFGDYTSSPWNQVKNYLSPPFTAAYEVDSTDAANGYVKYYLDGDPYFDGNYLASDGGYKTDGSTRHYYESSLSNSQFRSYSPSNNIGQIDALIYTNHFVGGRISSAVVNGSLIGRDDAIVFSGWITMNFDYRVKENGREYININLPIALRDPKIVRWSF